jgi:hypothetical protein
MAKERPKETKAEKARRMGEVTFTDREDYLSLFMKLLPVVGRTVEVDILMIHGMGGIGKSELLNQFKLTLNRQRIPVAYVDAQSVAGIRNVLEKIYDDLKEYPELAFPEYEEGIERIAEIEKKLLNTPGFTKKTLEYLVKVARGGLSFVPVVGPSLKEVMPDAEDVSALLGKIHQAIGKEEGDYLLQPEGELTKKMVSDLNEHVEEQRVVLIIDTYEHMAHDDWLRDDLFGQLTGKVLLVMAGRKELSGRNWEFYESNGMLRQVDLTLLKKEDTNAYFTKKTNIKDKEILDKLSDAVDGYPYMMMLLANALNSGQISLQEIVANPTPRKEIQKVLDRITSRPNSLEKSELQETIEVLTVLRAVNKDNLRSLLNCDEKSATALYDRAQQLDYTLKRPHGLTLHDIMWKNSNKEMRNSTPVRYRELHDRAIKFYSESLERASPSQMEGIQLELLYHRFHVDELDGLKVFKGMAQRWADLGYSTRLLALIEDVGHYAEDFQEENTRLWLLYYRAQYAALVGQHDDAWKYYEQVSENLKAEQRLRAYALCDWGHLASRPEYRGARGVEFAVNLLKRSLLMAERIDSKISSAYSHLGDLSLSQGRWEEAIDYIDKRAAYARSGKNSDDILTALNSRKNAYALLGDWKNTFDTINQTRAALDSRQPSADWQIATRNEDYIVHAQLIDSVPWATMWAGRYAESEQICRKQLDYFELHNVVQPTLVALKDLALTMTLQDRFDEAEATFEKARQRHARHKMQYRTELAALDGAWGLACMRQGKLPRAEELLLKSKDEKEKLSDLIGVPELYNWLGELHEMKASRLRAREADATLRDAESYYLKTLELDWTNRRYFLCGAQIGLLRVRWKRGNVGGEQTLLQSAEAVALKYEYNDLLAMLKLLAGHAAWQVAPEDPPHFEEALRFYKHALVYALRYNRFLLDEVLSGRAPGSVHAALIPFCAERGEAGKRMLSALRQWWQTGENDVGSSRADSLSPCSEGRPLPECELLARKLESGNGSHQTPVIERLDSALAEGRKSQT